MSKLHTVNDAAKDIEKKDPLLAYFVNFYAVQLGINDMKSGTLDAAGKTLLGSVMNELEALKKKVTVPSNKDGGDYVRKAAAAQVSSAQDRELAGKCDEETARLYDRGALLFESMSQFGPVPQDAEQTRNLAILRAQIVRAGGNKPQTQQHQPQPPREASISPAPAPPTLEVMREEYKPPQTAATNAEIQEASKLVRRALMACQNEDSMGAAQAINAALHQLHR